MPWSSTWVRPLLGSVLFIGLTGCLGPGNNGAGYGGGDPEFQLLNEIQRTLVRGLDGIDSGQHAGLLCQVPEASCPAGIDSATCERVRQMSPEQRQECQHQLRETASQLRGYLNRDSRLLVEFVQEAPLSDDGHRHHGRTQLSPSGQVELWLEWFLNSSQTSKSVTLVHEILHKIPFRFSNLPNGHVQDAGQYGVFQTGRQMLDLLGSALTVYSGLFQNQVACPIGSRRLTQLPLCVDEDASIELYLPNGRLVFSYELDVFETFESGQQFWVGAYDGKALLWGQGSDGTRNPEALCEADLFDGSNQLVSEGQHWIGTRSPGDNAMAIYALNANGTLNEWNGQNCAQLGNLRRSAPLRNTAGGIMDGNSIRLLHVNASNISAVGGVPERYYEWVPNGAAYDLFREDDPRYDGRGLPVVLSNYDEMAGTHLGDAIIGMLSKVDNHLLVWTVSSSGDLDLLCENRLVEYAGSGFSSGDFRFKMLSTSFQGLDRATFLTVSNAGTVRGWHLGSCGTSQIPDVSQPLVDESYGVVPGSTLESFTEGTGADAGYFIGLDTHLSNGSARSAGQRIRYVWNLRPGNWRLVRRDLY